MVQEKPKNGMGKISMESGVTGWTSHDLKRTGRTIMAKLQIVPHMIKLLLSPQPYFSSADFFCNTT